MSSSLGMRLDFKTGRLVPEDAPKGTYGMKEIAGKMLVTNDTSGKDLGLGDRYGHH